MNFHTHTHKAENKKYITVRAERGFSLSSLPVESPLCSFIRWDSPAYLRQPVNELNELSPCLADPSGCGINSSY